MCPSGSIRPKIAKKGDVYFARWKQPKGQQVIALWTSKGTETLSLNSAPVNAYDMMGNKLDIQSNTIVVSPSITYIIGKVEL